MEQTNNTGFSLESLRLIGAALALQQATATAANIVPLPGTGRFVVIGTPAEVARLLEIAPAASPAQPSAADAFNALQAIIDFPVTEPANMDAWNLREIARRALKSTANGASHG